MNAQEIRETYEFELALAGLMMKGERWECKPKELRFTSCTKSRATRTGIIYLSVHKYVFDECKDVKDYQALRHDIRHIFADLHCGFANRENFVWQRIAKKLGAVKENTATDLCECDLCGTLSPLVKAKRCIDCRKLEIAIIANPKIAYQILDKLTDGGNTGL